MLVIVLRQQTELLRYQGILWFNQESFESLISWLFTITLIRCLSKNISDKEIQKRISIITIFQKAEKKSDFQVEKLLRIVRQLD